MGIYAQPLSQPGFSACSWQWPNILAVDVALVAIVWQQWLGGGVTGAAPALVLGLSVWLVYIADHWMDARNAAEQDLRSGRHRFARRWQRLLVPLWLCVLVADVMIALLGLSRLQMIAGALLLTGCLLYLSAVQRHWPVPKELIVALIFAAGAAVFLVGQLPLPLLAAGAGCLFLLAFANCSLIAFREIEIDRIMGHGSFAQQCPGGRVWALGCLVVAAVLGVVLGLCVWGRYLAISVSALGLLVLGTHAERLPPELFRVLADAMLLLPGLGLLL